MKLLTVLKVLTIVRILKLPRFSETVKEEDEDKNQPEKQQHESRYCLVTRNHCIKTMGPNHEQEFAVLESQEQNLWCGIGHWPFDRVPALMRENYRSHERNWWHGWILIRASDYVHTANTIKLFHQRAKDHPTSPGRPSILGTCNNLGCLGSLFWSLIGPIFTISKGS